MSADSNMLKTLTSFTEDEQHVAGNALNAFNANQYEAALAMLKKIQKNHSNDARLMHNRALTEFFKSGKTKIADLKKSLVKIQKQLHQITKEDEEIAAFNEKNNYIALYFNQALLFYNLHQYSEAESILEKLHDNLDGSEESLLLKISLLLIDTCLHTYNTEKANYLIAKVEKTYLSTDGTAKKSANNDEKVKSTMVLSAAETDALRIHICYVKCRCNLQLKSIKSCKKEMKLFSNTSATQAGGNQTGVTNIASVFLKSNFEHVRCNYHKALKLLNGSPPPSSNAGSNSFPGLSAMYYNDIAVIHFGLGKYNIGTYYMVKALHENDMAVSLATKQHYSSLGSGSSRHQQQPPPTGKPLHVLNINKRFELLYNSGLQLLYAGNPTAAFDYLLAAAYGFHSNPRLWLRLAECCIQKYTMCLPDGNSKNKKSHVPHHCASSTVGSGIHRKTVLNSLLQSLGGKCNNTMTPSPTLEYASVCLNNALTILNVTKNTENSYSVEKEDKRYGESKTNEEKSTPAVACLPGPPVFGQQLDHLYASVLLNSAFVALGLGNNVMALEHSQRLLSMPKLSGCHRYLANMYAAEALVLLDRISEAIGHLSTDKINSISTDLDDNGKKSPVSDDGSIISNQSSSAAINQSTVITRQGAVQSPWHFPESLSCAHGFMLLNLANAHCLRSEYEKALGLLQQASYSLTSKQVPPQAIFLAVYLHLSNSGVGSDTALQLLRFNTLVLTPQQLNFAMPKNGSTLHGNTLGGGSANSSSVPVSDASSSNGPSRSKSSTPQPSSGGATPDRVVKAKVSEGKKRNRR